MLKKILKTASTIRSKESHKMDSKKLECRQCHQTEVLRRDAQTGMWELMVGYAAISNSSWQYLEDTWLDIVHHGCQEIPAAQVLRA
jgi:nitrate/TMAO reductase-like tetraheme cytochrome c subunit